MIDILMPTSHEALNAIRSGSCGTPQFSLTAREAEAIMRACEMGRITGPLMNKVLTLYHYASAKEWQTGRTAAVKME